MIQYITSKNNAKIKKAVSLKTNKGRQNEGAFLAEGKKALELALKSNLLLEVFTLSPLSYLDEKIDQYVINEEILNKISSSINPEGIVFICKIPTYSLKKEYAKIIYFDDIQDPGNMGTIIRTALAFNYDAVVASKDSVSFFNEKVVAASKGAIFLMPLIEEELINIKDDRKIIASALKETAINLKDSKQADRMILVLGNEAHGIKEKNLQIADEIIKIDIDNIDSLNVAIAGGILMYHFK